MVQKIFGDDAHRVVVNMSGDCFRVEWEDSLHSVRVNEKNMEDKIEELYYDVACENASEFGVSWTNFQYWFSKKLSVEYRYKKERRKMSCPDPTHDYEDWTDNQEQSDEKKQETEKKPSIVDFYQYQYRRNIWKARVRKHMKG